MTVLELVHIGAASSGLVLGLVLLVGRKGTPRHRRIGRTFVAALLIANGAALLSYEDGRFSMFHGLALVSLACLAAGLWALRRRRTLRGRIDHATWMSWTYAGLVAAGTGQMAALIDMPSLLVILGVVGITYWLLSIHRFPARAAERARPAGGPEPSKGFSNPSGSA